ncbi:MAG: transposase, partial [Thermodesulfobacteriota bacterium]
TKLTADSGFHTEANMKMLAGEKIDGYVADRMFRKRDPRFIAIDHYKERHRKERARIEGRKGLFKTVDFTFAKDFSYCICPSGKRLYRNGNNISIKNFRAHKFKGPKSACVPCQLRSQCLRYPERTEIRQVAYFLGRSEKGKNTFTEKMKRKIDSAAGRLVYSMRMGTVEPVFANICSTLGLDRFTLRGRTKVNSQWNLFCMIHNMKKIHSFGPGFA